MGTGGKVGTASLGVGGRNTVALVLSLQSTDSRVQMYFCPDSELLPNCLYYVTKGDSITLKKRSLQFPFYYKYQLTL